MISKKYLDDYKLFIDTAEDGKVSNSYQYVGNYYRFDLSDKKARSLRIYLFLLTLAMMIVFITPLLMYSTLTRVVYVILPYLLLLVPIYLLSKAVFSLHRNHGNLKREEKEHTFDRLKGIPFFLFFILLIEVIGQITAYIKWSPNIGLGDFVLSGATFILLVLAFLFFLKMKNISIKILKKDLL